MSHNGSIFQNFCVFPPTPGDVGDPDFVDPPVGGVWISFRCRVSGFSSPRPASFLSLNPWSEFRGYSRRAHRPRIAYFSAAKRREDVDETAARGLMGTRRRGGGTFQPWVKPEVDPPRFCARQRDSHLGRAHRLHMTYFSGTPPSRTGASSLEGTSVSPMQAHGRVWR
jgi:hypothetical protein